MATNTRLNHSHPMNVTLREFVAADLPRLDAWIRLGEVTQHMSRWTPRSFSDGAWVRHLSLWWVIVADQVDVGTIWIERTAPGDTTGELGILIADPQYRGHGIGGSAIALAETEAVALWTLEQVRLRVRQANQQAIRCYAKVGFAVSAVTEKPNDAGEPIAIFEMVHPQNSSSRSHNKINDSNRLSK